MNTHTVAFADTAEDGMLNIVDYIALDNPIRAISFVEELAKSLRMREYRVREANPRLGLLKAH